MPQIVRMAGPSVVLAVAFAALVVALVIGGGADPLPLQDAGPAVRWGLPCAKLFVNLGAAGTIGALILACFALDQKSAEYEGALRVGAVSAAVLTLASIITGIFTCLDVTGLSISNPTFGDNLVFFVTHVALGQAWLATALLAAVVAVLCVGVRNQTALVFVTMLAIATLVPMAQQGHAAGISGHAAAITSLGLHLLFACVWLGGIVTIVVIALRVEPGRIAAIVQRYSTLALISFLVVAVSGYVSAELRVGTIDELFSTPYGFLVLVKVVALIILGVFGYAHRAFLIRLMRDTPTRCSAFWWFVVAELAFMGLAFGVAAGLARTATPVPQEPPITPTPAQILTGEPLPPPASFANYIGLWDIDVLWLLLCAFGIFFYLAGVWRLRRRGDAWPVYRPIAWVLGMVVLFYVTSGGPSVYGMYLFSGHMVEHMSLTMLVPIFLVVAAPVTLALRTINKRDDGSRGPREWILLAVHSRYAKIITHPLVTAFLFVGSLWVFYYSPLFIWTLSDHIGHEWMVVHFVITGFLFVQTLIGIDPVPYRFPYPGRLALLLGTMVFHAFFGLAIMSGNGLLLPDWFGAMGWGTDALADQRLGGSIAWSIGEIPTLILAIVVAVQWSRHDTRESKRRDRQADRDGDTELHAYNKQLAELARHSQQSNHR